MSSIAHPKTRSQSVPTDGPVAAPSHPAFFDQELFMTMLRLERKRTERSHRRFVLMLLEACNLLKAGEEQEALDKVVAALSHSTRETDIKGWYKDDSVIGVIFTEVGAAEGKSIANALLTKVTNALCATLSIEQINEIKLSFHVFSGTLERNGWSNGFHVVPGSGANQRPQASRALDQTIDGHCGQPVCAGSLLAFSHLHLGDDQADFGGAYFVPSAESWAARAKIHVPEVSGPCILRTITQFTRST